MNSRNHLSQNPLHFAVLYNHRDLTKFICDHKFDDLMSQCLFKWIKEGDPYGQTPLRLAYTMKRWDHLCLMGSLQKNENNNEMNIIMMRMFTDLSTNNIELDIIIYFITGGFFSVDFLCRIANHTIFVKNEYCLKLILDTDQSILSYKGAPRYPSLLANAVERNWPIGVKLLIEYGANPYECYRYNKSPATYAAYLGNSEICQLIEVTYNKINPKIDSPMNSCESLPPSPLFYVDNDDETISLVEEDDDVMIEDRPIFQQILYDVLLKSI